MHEKNLVLVLTTNQDYIRHTGEEEQKFAAELNYFFNSISDTYLPLLRMFENLERDNVNFSLSLVISPSSCTLLEDPVVQKQYLEWLDKKIELGKKEIERCSGNVLLLNNAKFTFEKYMEDKIQFLNLNQRVLKKIREYQKKGYVEILATCATPIFMPFYADQEEILNAQVETGLNAYKCFFNEIPDGFWLPELGYASGIEKILCSYGLSYTILDTRSLLFSEIEPLNGIFTPARFENSLACFGRCYKCDEEIFSEHGYASNSVYKNRLKDIAYIRSQSELEPCICKNGKRFDTGYSYWNNSSKSVDALGKFVTDSSSIYDIEKAFNQCKTDAEDFVCKKMHVLQEAEKNLSAEQYLNLVCTIDLDKLRYKWSEGINFLENVFRCGSWQQLNFSQCKKQVGNVYSLQKIKPYYGSMSGEGYGENLLSHKNSWMMRYIQKASERMVDLAERFSTDNSLKARLLNLGAKELMLCQSSQWAKFIDENIFADYAEYRFKQGIKDFTSVFDALGSNTVSTEWLTNLENKHLIFPWMNYRIFCKKHLKK